MEPTENLSSSDTAVLDPPADAAAPSAEPPTGESGAPPEPDAAQLGRSMNDFMRGVMGQDAPTSKPEDGTATGESAPADAGDVEAGSAPARGTDGRFLPRRGIPEAVRSAEEKIADLERQLAERDPEKIREQLRNEDAQQALSSRHIEDAERYEAACRMPDSDPRLMEYVPNDPEGRTLYQWREDRKELIAKYPEAEAAIRASVEQRAQAQWASLLGQQRAEIIGVASELGVDPDRWKQPGTTWASMTRDAVSAATAPLQDRITALERELHSARTNGLGGARAPVAAGRSSGGARPQTMNDWLRG